MEGRARVEPSADMRQAANLTRQYYLALIEQGFNKDQALSLTASWIAAIVTPMVPPSDEEEK
jgi:hypothetical protein